MITSLSANIDYLETVSQAVRDRPSQENRELRIGGVVVLHTLKETPQGAVFRLGDGKAIVFVNVTNIPSKLFAECAPGWWWKASGPAPTSAADNLLVKHGATYGAASKTDVKSVKDALAGTGCEKPTLAHDGELGTFTLMVGVTASLLGIVVLGRGIATGNEPTRAPRPALLDGDPARGGRGLCDPRDRAVRPRLFDQVRGRQRANATPGLYTFTVLWSALQGSILLWALILGIYIVATGYGFRKRVTDPLVAWATIVQYVVALFFFGLMATIAGPLATTSGFVPLNGQGPNPLLQDHPLVAFHPPFLYPGLRGHDDPVQLRDRRARHRSLR